MPKIIIHAPDGTFNNRSREAVAGELTDFALGCERLPLSPFVKSTVWTYFNEYARDTVYMGSDPADQNIISLQIYTIEGGLNEESKKQLIEGATAILGRHSNAGDRIPVYIVVHEMPETNWGIFGKQADLAALRASAPDAPAI